MQATIGAEARFSGVSLHSGRPVQIVIRPAKPDHGIVFKRVDLHGSPLIQASWDRVVHSELCTLIRSDAGASVSTIEHLMAALSALGIVNALIDIDGAEAPILDGSAAPFIKGILAAGVKLQDAPRRSIRVLRPIRVSREQSSAILMPAPTFSIEFHIDFPDRAIGKQSYSLENIREEFVRDIADCRTFCREADVLAMRRRGLALGGTYENAVVFDGDRVLSPGGLRHKDEPVRHKVLDAIGDLALAGAPLIGRYRGDRAGHSLTNSLLRALFADADAWRFEEEGAVAA